MKKQNNGSSEFKAEHAEARLQLHSHSERGVSAASTFDSPQVNRFDQSRSNIEAT